MSTDFFLNCFNKNFLSFHQLYLQTFLKKTFPKLFFLWIFLHEIILKNLQWFFRSSCSGSRMNGVFFKKIFSFYPSDSFPWISFLNWSMTASKIYPEIYYRIFSANFYWIFSGFFLPNLPWTAKPVSFHEILLKWSLGLFQNSFGHFFSAILSEKQNFFLKCYVYLTCINSFRNFIRKSTKDVARSCYKHSFKNFSKVLFPEISLKHLLRKSS